MSPEREALVRQYAAGTTSWNLLRQHANNYFDLLVDLAELGLRPPLAPAQDQERARTILRKALDDAPGS